MVINLQQNFFELNGDKTKTTDPITKEANVNATLFNYLVSALFFSEEAMKLSGEEKMVSYRLYNEIRDMKDFDFERNEIDLMLKLLGSIFRSPLLVGQFEDIFSGRPNSMDPKNKKVKYEVKKSK